MELQSQKKNGMKLGRVTIPQGLPPSDISLIQQSFRMVASQGNQIVSRFYDLLFERFPELRSFFRSNNPSQQQTNFLNGLCTLILYLENPQALRSTLVRLGERHQRFGIEVQHYSPVVNSLLQVLTESWGKGMNGKTYEAWEKFLHLIRAIMLESYSPEARIQTPDGMSHNAMGENKAKRILLIDDDRQLLDLYQSFLETQRYVCSQVSDVAWAFTHLQMSRYDLVLTDFQMPVMNGIQLRNTFANSGNGPCPPFILVTGGLSDELQKQALTSGFVSVQKKHHDLTELGSIIRATLKNLETSPEIRDS